MESSSMMEDCCNQLKSYISPVKGGDSEMEVVLHLPPEDLTKEAPLVGAWSREVAATKIQATVRGKQAYDGYRNFCEFMGAIICIQRYWRGYQCRCENPQMVQIIDKIRIAVKVYYRRQAAAIVIQRFWRRILQELYPKRGEIRAVVKQHPVVKQKRSSRRDSRKKKLAAAICIQRYYRGSVQRRRYIELRKVALQKQRSVRKRVQDAAQSFYRRSAKRRFRDRHRYALVIQAVYRGSVARERLSIQRGAARNIQHFWRGAMDRQIYLEYKSYQQAAREIQSRWHAHVAQEAFEDTRCSIVLIQSVVRMLLAKKRARAALALKQNESSPKSVVEKKATNMDTFQLSLQTAKTTLRKAETRGATLAWARTTKFTPASATTTKYGGTLSVTHEEKETDSMSVPDETETTHDESMTHSFDTTFDSTMMGKSNPLETTFDSETSPSMETTFDSNTSPVNTSVNSMMERLTCVTKVKECSRTKIALFVVAFLVALVALLAPWWQAVMIMDGLCSPVMPGTRLGAQPIVQEAPWWAPDSEKATYFDAFCGERARTRLQWDKRKVGSFNLNVCVIRDDGDKRWRLKSDANLCMEGRRLKSVSVHSDHMVLTKDKGAENSVEAPWMLKD